MVSPVRVLALKRQRNAAAVAAALCLLIAMVLTLPRALRTRDELKRVSEATVKAQKNVDLANESIRDAQNEIRETQTQIARLLNSR